MPITMGALATATLMGARPKDTNKPVRILTPQLSSVLNVPGLCRGLDAGESRFFFNGNLGKKQDFSLAISASSTGKPRGPLPTSPPSRWV